MDQSERDLLTLYELEWGLEEEPRDEKTASRLRDVAGTLLMALVVGAASLIPTRVLVEWWLSGWRPPGR